MEQGTNKKIARRLFRDAFVLLVIVGVLDLVALKLDFFWTVHNFDSLLHLIGGTCVGLGALWLRLRGSEKDVSKRQIFITTVFSTLLVGIIWEMFELANGITFLSDGIHYVIDSGS